MPWERSLPSRASVKSSRFERLKSPHPGQTQKQGPFLNRHPCHSVCLPFKGIARSRVSTALECRAKTSGRHARTSADERVTANKPHEVEDWVSGQAKSRKINNGPRGCGRVCVCERRPRRCWPPGAATSRRRSVILLSQAVAMQEGGSGARRRPRKCGRMTGGGRQREMV